jgi:O-methyltransferase
MGGWSRRVSPLVPRRLKDAIKHEILGAPEPEDHFRICSPATAPELAHCLFELHRGGKLEGRAYYEFGLFRGYALWFVQDLIRRLGVADFHCHGFDSFAGLPKPEGVDEGAPWSEGDYAVSRERVERYLRQYGTDFSMVSLYEGFFSGDHFARLERRTAFSPAALVLVDCDLYASTVPVLRFIADHLADGAILLFDDYNCFGAADDRGQRRALREFLAGRHDIKATPLRAFGWHGQTFHIERITADHRPLP